MTGAEFKNYGDGFESMARGLLQLVNCAKCRFGSNDSLICQTGVREEVGEQVLKLAMVHAKICDAFNIVTSEPSNPDGE